MVLFQNFPPYRSCNMGDLKSPWQFCTVLVILCRLRILTNYKTKMNIPPSSLCPLKLSIECYSEVGRHSFKVHRYVDYLLIAFEKKHHII